VASGGLARRAALAYICRMADLDLALAMETARRAAEAASAAALRHFRTGVRVETKPDRSPVTAADREAEAAALAVIRAAFPEHAVLGEESGAHAGSAGSRWIVDPIDGTRGFTRGGGFWGPLVALEVAGAVVAGAMALPALGETYWAARGQGCWLRVGAGGPTRLRVSGVADWPEATLSLGELRFLLAPPLGERVAGLARTAASVRCYGDLAGAAMVLTGRAEAWIEAGVQVWDLAALQVLVEEAGGRFTDLEGRPSAGSGACLATNGRVHDQLLKALRTP
jgi:histidinol-phosphatase